MLSLMRTTTMRQRDCRAPPRELTARWLLVLGFRALAVPGGFSSDGLPFGFEFLGRPFAEGTPFRAAYDFEQSTKIRRPPARVK
jgi:amidase